MEWTVHACTVPVDAWQRIVLAGGMVISGRAVDVLPHHFPDVLHGMLHETPNPFCLMTPQPWEWQSASLSVIHSGEQHGISAPQSVQMCVWQHLQACRIPVGPGSGARGFL